MEGRTTREAALILAGTGCGKTLIEAIAPYIIAPWMSGRQVLMLSDNCVLRSRFLRDFPTDSNHRPLYDQWLLYSLKVLPSGVVPPQIVELDAGDFQNYAFCLQQADILVGNRQFLVNLVQRGDIAPEAIGLIVCDEAHFSAASSYRTITNYFSEALLCYFTGSKFRSDSQPLPNVRYTEVEDLDELGRELIRYAPVPTYQFTLQQAWKLDPPPIKRLCLQEATSTAFLVQEKDGEVEYDPETFFAKAQNDRAWFREILLADSFCLPVLEMAVRILMDKRSHTGQPHAMLVRALNIPHVHRVAKLLEENFPFLKGRVGIVHSERDEFDLAGRPNSILERFYSSEDLVLVHCGMVGVGFDHKWVAVSCCLCVLKSMSPAEQEWGRALRKVPGPPPGQFPQLNHPNWAVLVTHESLGLRQLFEKFQQGVTSEVVKEAVTEKRVLPTLTIPYEAGETVLKLSDTKTLAPGDVLELQVPVFIGEAVPPKFNLTEELRRTGSLSEMAEIDAAASSNGNGTLGNVSSHYPPSHEERQVTVLPWQQEVDAIGQKLAEIKSLRTHHVQVQAVLSGNSIQIEPAWFDFPAGVQVTKTRNAVLERHAADFLQHVGLDWQVLVDGEMLSYQTYQKRIVLQKHGMSLDSSGEILSSGVRLKDTMPLTVYELFLKGLEVELANAEVEVPHAEAIARPDKAKLETQGRYGVRVRSLVNDLFKQRGLIRDGQNGNSLVEKPVDSLAQAIERVRAKGNEPSFKSNSELVHSATFGFIKDKTGKSWSEHQDEEQYQEACHLAHQYLLQLKEQLQWRSWR